MRTSRFFLATVKETPSDAEIISHQLMIRAGMMRRVAAGIYNWLPMGLRVLRKVETIVREEMDRAGALELLMPGVQPAELWRESGRWEAYGPELLRIQDRHQREFCLGPTHEEVITDIVRTELRSYRQLPLNMYQIQWKFRDEIRPRFGVMRGREFLMKDAYSFDASPEGMRESYEVMRQAYVRIFDRLQLDASAVAADSGAIGGSHSHEFHVLADTGEDAIGICTDCAFAANIEALETTSTTTRAAGTSAMEKVATPGVHTIADLCQSQSVQPEQTIKTLLVRGETGLVALLLRGDHELNSIKAEKIDALAVPLQFASAAEIKNLTGSEPGSIGPVGLDVPIIADHAALACADFICGANENDTHLTHVNFERDLPIPQAADLRMVTDGEACQRTTDTGKCAGTIQVRRGIEVGHIFQLGTTYSDAMKASVLDEGGKPVNMYMGCYGIGVSRIVAAAIEQNHDDNGIIWPMAIAPFQVCIVPIGMNKSEKVRQQVETLYAQLTDAGIDVLLDDRNERPGVMFANMELVGIPHRLVIGERGLDSGIVEYQPRAADAPKQELPINTVVDKIRELV